MSSEIVSLFRRLGASKGTGILLLLLAGCDKPVTQPQPTDQAPLDSSVKTEATKVPSSVEDEGFTKAQAASKELVFRATVQAIVPMPRKAKERWSVTVKVDEVLTGSYAPSTFSFGIHSPTKSKLMVGGEYTVRATVAGTGYIVDELQWVNSP